MSFKKSLKIKPHREMTPEPTTPNECRRIKYTTMHERGILGNREMGDYLEMRAYLLHQLSPNSSDLLRLPSEGITRTNYEFAVGLSRKLKSDSF